MGLNQSVKHSEPFSFSNLLWLMREYNCAEIVFLPDAFTSF